MRGKYVLALAIVLFIMVVQLKCPCVFKQALANSDQTITFSYPDFRDADMNALLKTNYNSYITSGKLRVVPCSRYQRGSVFYNNRVSLANERSFSAFFSFQLTGYLIRNGVPSRADGFVFVIQTQSNTAGSAGGGMGYSGISPSVGIEFDTWNNGEASTPHIGIDLNGSVNSVRTVGTSYNITNGGVYYAWIDYDGPNKIIEVRLSNTPTRPETPKLSYSLDLTSTLNMDEVYVGFTSATGTAGQNHDILSWYFNNDYSPIDTENNTYVNDASGVSVTAEPSSNTKQSTVTATVTDVDGNPSVGTTVTFSTDNGILSSSMVTTDSNGQAVVMLNSGGPAATAVVKAVASGGAYGTVGIQLLANNFPEFTEAEFNTNQIINEGTGLTGVSAIDADPEDTVYYTLTDGSLPEGITLNNDGTFSGTASYDSAGDYNVQISASDEYGGMGVTSLDIMVMDIKPHASASMSEPIAGEDNLITLTMKDQLENIDEHFDGNKEVTISGVEVASDGSYGSFNGVVLNADSAGAGQTILVNFTDGKAEVNLVLTNAAAQIITFGIEGAETSETIAPTAATAADVTMMQDIIGPASNGGEFAQQPVIAIKDTYGNVCTGDNATQVTASKKDAGDWTLTGTKTVTASNGIVTFTDLGAVNSVQVDNAQLAFNASGLTEVTSTTVTLSAPDAPSAPVIQSAVAGDGYVDISWNPVPSVTGYKIYQSATSGLYDTPAATVADSVYSHRAGGLTNGTAYYFVVKATNGGGDSAYSNEASAIPEGVPDAPSAPVIQSAIAGDGYVDISWSPVPSVTGYKIYQSATSGLYDTPAATVADSVYSHRAGGLTNGTAYYFVVRATNGGDDSAYSNEASATPKRVAGAPTGVIAEAGHGQAVISFNAPTDNGGSPIIRYIVTSNPDNIIASGTKTTITVTGLSNGTTYLFTVQAVNEVGNGQKSAVSNEVTPYKRNSSEPTLPIESTNPSESGIEILINGNKETAATATTTVEEDKTITTITVDDKKIEEKLQQEGSNAVVTIPFNNNADVIVGQLNGQTVKDMETKEAVVEIKTKNITYTLPALQINIDNVSEQIGSQVELKDITVDVEVSASSQDIVKIVEDTANKNNYQIVVEPVDFRITCSSGNKTVEVSEFNAYVERMVAIPDDVDPSKITTGVILNPDGSFSHVPTVIKVIDGKYYAKINSLTNSTYSVIYSSKTFTDVENHWAKDAVNDMSSRLVVNGMGYGRFAPDNDITRAEFTTIIVNGLGLMRPGLGKAVFTDVEENAWYYNAVSIAYEYGLISGYGNGQFKPMKKMTREQAMAVIARAMEITGMNTDFSVDDSEKILTGFTDSKEAGGWAKNAIAECIKTGIIYGKDEKTLASKDNITRAEVAVIIRRLLQKSKLI